MLFPGPETPFVYFSTRGEIQRVDIRNSLSYSSVLDKLENTIGLDFDWKEQRIYWSDLHTDNINRCFLNGTGREEVITTGLITAEGCIINVNGFS